MRHVSAANRHETMLSEGINTFSYGLIESVTTTKTEERLLRLTICVQGRISIFAWVTIEQ